MNSPFRNFDAWLTTDRSADAAEAAAEHVWDAWAEYAEAEGLPIEIGDVDHPEHNTIYGAWETLFMAVEDRRERLLAEQEAKDYQPGGYFYESEKAQGRCPEHTNGRHVWDFPQTKCVDCGAVWEGP